MPQVNDRVYFKPTERGKDLLKKNGMGFRLSKKTLWVEMQFWEFLSVFGPEFPKSPSVVREPLTEDGMIYFEKPY